MEYSTEKKTYTGIILIGVAFLAVGAAVIYFLVIAPSLRPSTDTGGGTGTTDTPDTGTDTGTDTGSDTGDDIFGGGSADGDTGDGATGDEDLPDTSTEDPNADLQDIDDVVWLLDKSGNVVCANDAGTLADVDYTITLENAGTIAGQIDEVIDSLATIVDEDMVSDISDGGTYDADTGQITWNNSGSGYAVGADASETFTYTVRFSKDLDQFTAVENDVTAAPGDGTLPPEPAESVINVGCGIPDTAIGDDDFLGPVLIITGSLLLVALVELKFGLITFLIGEERLDSLKLAMGSNQSKSIVEKRIKRKVHKK